MAGCFGSHPYDRAMERELNRYLDAQDAAEQREEQIQAIADDLMKEGEECYPFSPFNLSEAMAELGLGEMKVLCAAIQTAENDKWKNDHANHLALMALVVPVRLYWEKIAKSIAEEELE